MAIGKVSGVMLQSNLERQGAPLAFEGNLLYLDVNGRYIGINTSTPTADLTVNGNAQIGNVVIFGDSITNVDGNAQVQFGNIGQVKLDGGNQYDTVYTNGQGTLSFGNLKSIIALQGLTLLDIPLGVTSQTDNNFGTQSLTLGLTAAEAISTLDDIVGNITNISGNVITTGNLFLTGGAQDYVLTTDGNGNTSWANLFILQSNVGSSGMNVTLGTPTDGSLTANAAYDGWTTSTKVTDALDNLNQMSLNIAQNTFVGNVQFRSATTAGPSPLTVTFIGTATGNPNTYRWDFGDGTSSTAGSTVTKTYSNTLGGQYTVTYTASNSNGTNGGNAAAGAIGSVDSFTRTNYITLYTPTPIPSFTTNATSINSGNTISLTDTSQYSTSYVIYWGDGTTTSNATPGGTKTHTYTNAGGDATYSIILQANSTTAGASNVTVNSSPVTTKVYSNHNSYISNVTTTRVINALSTSGGVVTLKNLTNSSPGSASTFGAQQYYNWYWGDTTANTTVAIGSGSAGDTNQNINHTYALTSSNQTNGVSQSFTTTMYTYTGNTYSPFVSNSITVTVEPEVRAASSVTANVVSDATSDTSLTGYIFTDYLGRNRSLFNFTSNSTQNRSIVNWNYGDSTTSGNLTTGAGYPGNAAIQHDYVSAGTGNKSVVLTAYGTPDSIAQSSTSTTTVVIKAIPSAPGALSSKTLSMSTSSSGTTPYLAAGAVDNTNGNIALAGTSVTRYTTSTGTVVTNTVTQANTSVSGVLTAYINRANAGAVTFSTSTSGAQTNNNLVVTGDADARSAISSSTYPTGFYKVFSAYISQPLTSANLGFNDSYLSHTVSGSTNRASYVVDNVTSVPTLVTTDVTISNVAATTIRTVSGIPYYQSGGNIVVQGLQAYNWIGQTYTTSTPLSISAGSLSEATSGTILSTQTKTYAQIDGQTTFLDAGVPKANTGNVISNAYTFGNIYISVNGSAAAVGNISTTLTSVNGTSTAVSLPGLINIYSSAYSGFDETSIACSAGAAAGNTTVAKRIVLNSSNVSTPIYANTATNYYSGAAWSSTSTVAGTTEAVIRWGNLKVNTTDYSSYLPPGPNLAVGGNRTTTQSFKFAFQRPIMQNMKVIFTGRVSGMYVAAPGTKITDTSSTLNGWMDANVAYAGSGYPGQGSGGNGSTGCAVGTPVPTNTFVSNVGYVLTLGASDLSTSTYKQCLINLVLGPNDFVSNIYIGSY